MTAADRQERLVEEYLLVEDPRERFQLIVETASAGMEPLAEEDRTETNLVPGCVSRVWLSVRARADVRLDVGIESESPALQGIAALYRRVYSGATPHEILATAPAFLERLGIDRHLTPTRLRGLRRLRERLVERAACFVPEKAG